MNMKQRHHTQTTICLNQLHRVANVDCRVADVFVSQAYELLLTRRTGRVKYQRDVVRFSQAALYRTVSTLTTNCKSAGITLPGRRELKDGNVASFGNMPCRGRTSRRYEQRLWVQICEITIEF